MENIRNAICILIILGILMGLMTAVEGGDPHTVYGYCWNASDGTPADGSNVTTYVQTRPGETENTTVGIYNENPIPNIWAVNTGNFQTPWSIGEILIVKVDNGAGCTANTSVNLTGAGADPAPNMTLICPPTPCLNITHDNTYINKSTTICKGVYNINTTNANSIVRINASNIFLDCDGATLIGNGNGRGVYNYNYSNVNIKNCIIMNYDNGIYLNKAHNNTLLNNTVKSNTNRGISLYNSDNCTVTNNTAKSNGNGTYLDQSDFNKIINNEIEGNTNTGVYFSSDSNFNNLTQNQVCFNKLDVNDTDNNSGDAADVNNTCDTTYNWNDNGKTRCTHMCSVTSTNTSTGRGVAHFSTNNGFIVNVIPLPESSLNSTGKPNLTFIYGFFEFNITGIANGGNVTVTITLPGNLSANSQYWKYGPNCNNNNITEWYQIPIGSNDGDNVITINLTDGGLGDDNCTQDGKIFDDGGPGSRTIDSKVCNGVKKDDFNPSDDICTFGNTTVTCDIYKCSHRSNYIEYNLTTNCNNISTTTGAFDNVYVCTGGDGNCTINSAHDLVLDCDRDGYYNESTDAIDNSNTVGGMDGGFYITPEPMAVMLFVAGLSVVYGLVRVNRKRKIK